jgi:hypothetical protein
MVPMLDMRLAADISHAFLQEYVFIGKIAP